MVKPPYLKLYIAVLDDAPDYMVPTLVGHSVLGAHLAYSGDRLYDEWLKESFRKVTIRVSKLEFLQIQELHPLVYRGYENTICGGDTSCLVPYPVWSDSVPQVLKEAKLWSPIAEGIKVGEILRLKGAN